MAKRSRRAGRIPPAVAEPNPVSGAATSATPPTRRRLLSVLVVGGLGSTFVVVVGLILGSMILSPVTDCTGSIHQHQREEALRGKILYFDPMHQVVTIPPGADPTTMPGYVRLSVADEQQFWRDHSGAITLAVWTSIWAYLQWPVYLLGLLVLAWLFRVSVFELIWDAFTDD